MNTWDQLVLHPFRNREIKNQRQLNRLTKLSSHVSISFDYVYGQISTFRTSFLRKNLPAFSSPFVNLRNCDPPQDFNAKGESTRTTRFDFKTKEFILTRFSTLAIFPH